MTEINQSSNNAVRPKQRDHRYKRFWKKAQTPLQLVIAQIIGWALRKWLG